MYFYDECRAFFMNSYEDNMNSYEDKNKYHACTRMMYPSCSHMSPCTDMTSNHTKKLLFGTFILSCAVPVCALMRQRERERECVCVNEREKKRERERKKERERESEGERER